MTTPGRVLEVVGIKVLLLRRGKRKLSPAIRAVEISIRHTIHSNAPQNKVVINCYFRRIDTKAWLTGDKTAITHLQPLEACHQI